VALGVRAIQEGKRKVLIRYLLITLVFGCTFLVIKGFEYAHKFEHHLFPGSGFVFHGADAQNAQLYFSLYFMMTGLHALHMIVGVGLLLVIVARAARGHFSPQYYSPVEVFGLYWHFVDIVWIFLYPLLYLINVHG
jgi:cytochrome c oxidase subunit 3